MGSANAHPKGASQAQSGLRRTPEQEHEHRSIKHGTLRASNNWTTNQQKKTENVNPQKNTKPHPNHCPGQPLSCPPVWITSCLFWTKNLFVFWVSLIFVFLQSSPGPHKITQGFGRWAEYSFWQIVVWVWCFLWEGWNSLFVKNLK